MTLTDVPLGVWLVITSMEPRVAERLAQYGLFVGDKTRVVRVAPLGGPLLLEVTGREIALAREIASFVQVEVV